MNKYLKKMIEEMNLRGLSEETQTCYLLSMRQLINYYDKSPELLKVEDLKLFLINKKKYNGEKLSHSTHNKNVTAFKFFYKKVLHRKWEDEQLPRMKRKKTIPIFFTQEEIKKMIDSLHNIKYKTIFMTMYSTGMRLSELIHLRPADIDSKRMVINIRQGKGGKDRQAILSPKLLNLLRTYWKENSDDKSKYLFAPSVNSFDPSNLSKHLAKPTIQYILKIAAKAAGIKKKSIHML